MDDLIKKKRGRKPKTHILEEVIVQHEKKKRGRKKKYELENFEKILHRESHDNFNHNIIYSDDESTAHEENCVKKISFGNLDITVSKKIETENISDFKLKTRMNINRDEYSSDEEKEVAVETFMNVNYYSENKRYFPKVVSECTNNTSDCIKKIKIVRTTTSQVKDSGSWPETCDVCCWWCCHPFEGAPCTLPIKYDPLRKRFTFCGLFCSWNCVKAYNFERSDYKRYYCSTLISLLIGQIYGIPKALGIKPAPPRQTLKMFGGYLEIHEFRQPSDIDAYQINLARFNYVHPEITEIKNVKQLPEKKNLRLSRPVI